MPAPTLLRRLRLDWPLLGKELVEQAARKQMYVLRLTYALLLFGGFCFYYLRYLSEGSVQALGRGLGPFLFLVQAQSIAIYLFLPPLMAGAIAQEKERDTLGLLFLTDLTPWELILQKYVGRLIPMLTLLLLSLPLLAVAYSLGGVSFSMLVFSAATLFLTCLAVGALALECSAHQATTLQALVRCWGLCLVFATCCTIVPAPLWWWTQTGFNAPARLSYGAPAFGLTVAAPMLFSAALYLVPTLLFLVRAKQHLERRAFVARRNPFGHQFKQLDQYWKDLRKLVRAIYRTRDLEAYTAAEQLVRQQMQTSDDTRTWSLTGFLFARMQVPNLLAGSILIGFIVFIFVLFGVLNDPRSAPLPVVVGGLWTLAAFTISIQGANLIARERMNERLDAILTTPLTGPEILNRWLAPLRRWIRFLSVPLAVVLLLEAVLKFVTQNPNDPRLTNLVLYLGISLLALWIYPRLIQWSCLWLGLRLRKQMRALVTAFMLVAAWCALPPLASHFLDETGLLPEYTLQSAALRFLSPVTVIQTAEMLGRTGHYAFLPADALVLSLLHLGLAAGLMWRIRQQCLRDADRYLGRV
jgi:ABC-type transport system involved in multi-copper enzyme maturation permease subunit